RHHVLDRVLVGAGLARLAREAAEGAREHADVGGRDVPVDDEVDAVALAPGLGVIGHAPYPQEVVALEQGETVLAAQALARADLVPDGLEPAIREAQRVLLDDPDRLVGLMLAAARTPCQAKLGRRPRHAAQSTREVGHAHPDRGGRGGGAAGAVAGAGVDARRVRSGPQAARAGRA